MAGEIYATQALGLGFSANNVIHDQCISNRRLAQMVQLTSAGVGPAFGLMDDVTRLRPDEAFELQAGSAEIDQESALECSSFEDLSILDLGKSFLSFELHQDGAKAEEVDEPLKSAPICEPERSGDGRALCFLLRDKICGFRLLARNQL
jgi:hypothetical protein